MEIIETLHLFEELDLELIKLLKDLDNDEWYKPTLAKAWTVKDVAAHLLDGNMRTISSRDKFPGDPPGALHSYGDLVNYLDGLNDSWVKAFKRVSPRLLTELLEITGKGYYDRISLMAHDPFGPSIYPVDWAGETVSANWFHVAREYTEKWHHQQQIREAVGRPGMMDRDHYYPAMDTFMRALPHSYRSVTASSGTVIDVIVTGESGGRWSLTRSDQHWALSAPGTKKPAVEIEIDPVTAWQLFTKGITPAEASKKITVKGDVALSTPLLRMVSVIGIRK